jgi:type IV pilus assembly protein PilW
MSTRPHRGVTLLELIIAMTISAVVMAGIVAVVNSQQRAYYDGHRQRAAQSTGRAALIQLEQAISMAGYGMDAPLAFDFDRYSGKASGKCPTNLDPCPRDSTGNSDEIVFHHRNPRYWVPESYGTEPAGKAWRITGLDPTGNTVTINARLGDLFPKGQILQAVCRAGEDYAYFTVSEKKEATAAGSLTINLVPSADTDPFLRQAAATNACFTGGQARLFLVERKRFHIRPVGTALEPYLVLDTGVDVNGDGTIDEADEFILAEGIELLQLGYVMTNSAALTTRGTEPGTAITFTKGAAGATSGTGMTTLDYPGTPKTNVPEYGWTSFYGYPVGPPPNSARLTDHQGNIRAVRVALVARSSTVDPNYVDGGQVPLLLNMDALPTWIRPTERFNRVTLETTVLVRNMVTRAMPDF